MKLTAAQKRLLLEADIDRRKLERSIQTGGPDAEVRLLAYKLRMGELSEKHIQVVAALGYEPARKLGLPEAVLDEAHFILDALVASNLDQRSAANFAADVAEQVLPIYEVAFPGDDRPRMAITAVRSGATAKNAMAVSNAAWDAALAAAWNADPDAEDAEDAVNKTKDPAALAALAAADAAIMIEDDVLNWAAGAAVNAVNAGLSKEWIRNRLIDYLLGRDK